MALDQDHVITCYILITMKILKNPTRNEKKHGTEIKKNIERMKNKENN